MICTDPDDPFKCPEIVLIFSLPALNIIDVNTIAVVVFSCDGSGNDAPGSLLIAATANASVLSSQYETV